MEAERNDKQQGNGAVNVDGVDRNNIEASQKEIGIQQKKENESEGTNEKGDNGEKSDPYAYTRREEFTSENFKIELRGLPRYYTVSHLKKLLNETLQLEAHKVKPAGFRKNWAYIAFRNEEARTHAMSVLQGYKWKKATFSVATARPVEDPLVKLRSEKGEREDKDQDNNLTIEERITKSVTPYAHLPYDEQLEMKQKEAHQILRKFGNQLAHVNPEVARIIQWQKQRRQGQVCEVDPIVPSPCTEGYRNKCEFTIGINPVTEKVTVGFRLASYKTGSMSVAPVSHLKHIPQSMKDVVREFEKFVQSTDLAPFSPMTHQGVWRQLTVRTSSTRSLLIIVVIHPQEMSEAEQATLKQKIVNHFTKKPGSKLGVTSICFKSYAQKERGESVQLEHLWGKQHLTESILGNTFRVSPDAFLQVNTAGAELLYEHIGDLACLNPSSVLLDVCCGTGTIGVCLAKRCDRVCGVELVPEAAEDARHNARENGADSVKVWTGRAEEMMPHLLEHCRGLKTVAVVDPPRAGLNTSVVVGLRRCSELNRLVYVSCDPASAVKNFINLGRPESKQYRGSFFFPIRAIPVDLFPHTPHFELVILFERWDEKKWQQIMEGNPLPQDVEYFNRVPCLPESSETDKDVEKEENVNESNKRTLGKEGTKDNGDNDALCKKVKNE